MSVVSVRLSDELADHLRLAAMPASGGFWSPSSGALHLTCAGCGSPLPVKLTVTN